MNKEQKNDKLREKCAEIFETVTETQNAFICPLLNEKTKVKQIERLKSFCAVNFSMYQLEIVFIGGQRFRDQNTAIKIQVIN